MNQDAVVKRLRSGWALHHDTKNNLFELRGEMMAPITIKPKVGKPTIAYLGNLLTEEQVGENNFVYVIKK